MKEMTSREAVRPRITENLAQQANPDPQPSLVTQEARITNHQPLVLGGEGEPPDYLVHSSYFISQEGSHRERKQLAYSCLMIRAYYTFSFNKNYMHSVAAKS